MRRRNSYLLVVVFLGLTAHFLAQSGSAPPTQPPQSTNPVPTPAQTAPAEPAAGNPQPQAPQSAPQGAQPAQAAPQGAGQPVNQGAGQAPETGDSGAFVFKKQV